MASPLRALPLVLVLCALPLASAERVRPIAQDETHVHVFDRESSGPCPAVLAHVRVDLTYAPPADTLVLSVDGVGSAVGVDGHARLDFWLPDPCTSFTARVEGASVGLVAAYDLWAWG